MARIGFKVVRRTLRGCFASVIAPIPLIYNLNVTTYHCLDSGPLALFASEDAAFAWALSRGTHVFANGLSILRCEWEPWDKRLPRETANAYSLALHDGGYYVRPTIFWQHDDTHSLGIPAGTRLAKSIKPLELICEMKGTN